VSGVTSFFSAAQVPIQKEAVVVVQPRVRDLRPSPNRQGTFWYLPEEKQVGGKKQLCFLR